MCKQNFKWSVTRRSQIQKQQKKREVTPESTLLEFCKHKRIGEDGSREPGSSGQTLWTESMDEDVSKNQTLR